MTDGLVIVDKDPGMTSHDVVARVRRLAHTRRVGHAGTLDPMATGVLVLGVGQATRLLHHLTGTDKTYRATVRLGAATVTDDAEGDVLTEASAAGVDSVTLAAAVARLTGRISQVPSAVSAIKVDGRRAYARVRAGEDVKLAPRQVNVTRFEVLRTSRPEPTLLDVDVVVDCSSGTYVRALARDLGTALATGGHLRALRRTRVGLFDLSSASSLAQLADLVEAAGDPVTLPLADALRASMPVRTVTAEQAGEIGFGRRIAGAGIDGTYGVLDPNGDAVALLRDVDGHAQPVAVFRAAG